MTTEMEKSARINDLLRLVALVVALGLMAAIVLSAIKLSRLDADAKALDEVEAKLETADVAATAALLQDLERDESELSSRQGLRREELLVRLFELAVERRNPVREVAGTMLQGNEGEVFHVAYERPPVVVALEPAVLLRWTQGVSLAGHVVPLSPGQESISVPLPVPPEALESGRPWEVPVEVVLRTPEGRPHRVPAGSFRIVVDTRPPSVVVGMNATQQRFATPTPYEVRLPVTPDRAPTLTVEDDQGLSLVRWYVDGVAHSKDLRETHPRRWQVPLDPAPFEKSGNEVAVRVEPENQIGNTSSVKLRFLVRSADFNPVSRILVEGHPLELGDTLEVDKARVDVLVEVAPGEDTTHLALSSGGRRYELTKVEGGLGATIDLDEGKPTGIAIVNGQRVLVSYKVRVKQP